MTETVYKNYNISVISKLIIGFMKKYESVIMFKNFKYLFYVHMIKIFQKLSEVVIEFLGRYLFLEYMRIIFRNCNTKS